MAGKRSKKHSLRRAQMFKKHSLRKDPNVKKTCFKKLCKNDNNTFLLIYADSLFYIFFRAFDGPCFTKKNQDYITYACRDRGKGIRKKKSNRKSKANV